MWYGEIWSEADMTQLSLMLYFSKTARNFFTILSLNIVDNIPFQMSLSSHLAALVWQTGVHTNVARNKEVIWRNLVGSWHDITNFDVILFKNGSKFSHNTYPAQSRQYFLSNKPGQPFSRAGLTDWRSYKRSENKDVIWRNLVRSWHDTTKFDVIFFKKRLEIFSQYFRWT